MTWKAMPDAANEAKKAAHKARELADLLDEYARFLSLPDMQERTSALQSATVAKRWELQEAFDTTAELVMKNERLEARPLVRKTSRK